MATGSRAAESLRAGIETTEGTPATPTRFLYPSIGGITLSVKNEPIRIETAWNKQDTLQDVLAGQRTDSLTLTGPLSYEDAHFLLSPFDANGLSAAPTGPTDGGYTRTGAPSQTDSTVSATGVRSMTVQYAPTDLKATTGVWQLAGLVGEDLVINFAKAASGTDTGVSYTAQYVTAQASTLIADFTASLSDRTQTYAIGHNLKCYIDTTTMGATADFDVTTAQFHLNKQTKYHSAMDQTNAWTSIHRPSGWTSQLTYTKKFSSLTEYNAYVGTLGQKTLRLVKIIAEGPLLGTTVKNTIELRFAGKYTDMGDLPQYISDEIWACNFTLDGIYNATLGGSWAFKTINGVPTAATTL